MSVAYTAADATVRGEASDLYQALCLQVLNIVIEGVPLRSCANERCVHYFTRQHGRAQDSRGG